MISLGSARIAEAVTVAKSSTSERDKRADEPWSAGLITFRCGLGFGLLRPDKMSTRLHSQGMQALGTVRNRQLLCSCASSAVVLPVRTVQFPKPSSCKNHSRAALLDRVKAPELVSGLIMIIAPASALLAVTPVLLCGLYGLLTGHTSLFCLGGCRRLFGFFQPQNIITRSGRALLGSDWAPRSGVALLDLRYGGRRTAIKVLAVCRRNLSSNIMI